MQQVHAVTGAFGFSGRYIAERLLQAGHKVVTFTNSLQRAGELQGKIEARPLCFDDADALAESMKDVDVFYNTYWVRFNSDDFTHSVAVKNTLTLFDAAKKAGVSRFVHVSISNADINSPFEYFSGKGWLEKNLRESGLSHAIVRPAVLFGNEGILINNIAWTLRKIFVFACFGNGNYHIQPIYVDDLARIMVEQGALREDTVVEALGPEDFTYKELVRMVGKAIGRERPIIPVPVTLGFHAANFIGKMVGDVFVTKEEIGGLMADLLHVPGAVPTGTTRLSDWVQANAGWLGTRYFSEMARRKDLRSAYHELTGKRE